MKGDSVFLDTNIFIYSISNDDKKKKSTSELLVADVLMNESGMISFQVVQEFFYTSQRKFAYKKENAIKYGKNFLFPMWDIYPSRDLYLKAIEIQERYQYSFYDSLIIAAALEGNCRTLYSEDLQHAQKIGSLTIVDPFKA